MVGIINREIADIVLKPQAAISSSLSLTEQQLKEGRQIESTSLGAQFTMVPP
jgi:plasmid replication initiation protein